MFIGLLKDMIEDIDKEIRRSSSGRVLQARASFLCNFGVHHSPGMDIFSSL